MSVCYPPCDAIRTEPAWKASSSGVGCASVHIRRPGRWVLHRRERYLSYMTSPTSAQQRAWMAQWRSAGVELARVGQAELTHVDLWRVAADLEDACVASAREARLASPSSGLIDQQRWLHRRARS